MDALISAMRSLSKFTDRASVKPIAFMTLSCAMAFEVAATRFAISVFHMDLALAIFLVTKYDPAVATIVETSVTTRPN